jgi:hypothetical protein
MSTESINTIGFIGGTFLTIVAVCAVVWKFLKPWLREQLFEPLQDVHKEVTVNGGKSNPPTLKDELSILGSKVDQLSADIRILALAFSSHVVTSNGLAERLHLVEAEVKKSA